MEKIRTLTGWRAIFIICIVLFHYNVPGFESMTGAGVAFFFILSGFLLTLRHPQGYNAWQYLRRHAPRFYAFQWAALLVIISLTLIFTNKSVPWWLATLHALLLQCWVPTREVAFTLNGQAWFLGSLMTCYALYPTLARTFGKWRLRHKAFVCAAAMLAIAIITGVTGEDVKIALYIFPVARLVDFLLGITLANFFLVRSEELGVRSYLARNSREKISTPNSSLLTPNSSLIEVGAVALLLIPVLINENSTIIARWDGVPLWWIPCAAIILCSAALNGREGIIGKILLSRPLQWLGNISFEIYMLHFVAIKLFNYLGGPLFGHFGIDVYDGAISIIAAWLILIPLSAWAHHLSHRKSLFCSTSSR